MGIQAQSDVSVQRDAGDVVIIGSQLVSPKLLDIAAHLLSDPEYFGKITSVKQIHFTEDQPEGKYGTFNIDNGAVMVNLQRHFDATVEKLKKDDNIHVKYLSFKTILWFDLITTLLHEFFHAEVCDSSPEACEAAKTDEDVRSQIENDCIGMASATIIDIFRDLEVEPPLMSMEPFFGTRYMQLFINDIKNGNEEWSIRQSIMHEKEYAFYDDARDEGMKTMRSWVRTVEGADPDHKDTRWDEDPHSIQCVEKAAVMVDTPLQEEEIVALVDDAVATLQTSDLDLTAAIEKDADAPKAEEVVEVVVEPAPEAAAVDLPPWDPATLDPDTAMVMSMDMEEPTDDEEVGGMGIMAAMMPARPYSELAADPSLGPPAVAPAPAERDSSELFVRKNCVCGVPPVANAKFCANCGVSIVAEIPPVVTAAVVAPPQAVLPVFAAPQGVVPQPAAQPQAHYTPQALRTGLPNINMDQATMRAILEEIYRRMHEHAFTKCGFQLCGGQTDVATGFHPAHAGNILQPISIADIPGAEQLIIGFDKNDNTTGKTLMNQPIVGGIISGKLTKKDQLPSYAIYINNNGIEQKRVFMVQNPFKITGSGYSSTALKAQAGHQISWVWDGADNLGGGRRWIYKTENQYAQWLA